MVITEMAARNARVCPNDIAFTELIPSKKVREDITHKQFDEKVNRLANALSEIGIVKSDKVLVWMANSVNFMVAYYGVAKIGAWAAPLNYRFSSEDLKYCADIAEAKVLIVDQEFSAKVQAIRSQLPSIKHYVCVGEKPPEDMRSFEEFINKAPFNPPKTELNGEDGAALYFTSGTTGTPKAVVLTHKNLECAAITTHVNYKLRHNDCYFLGVPMYHISPPSWWGASIVGGRLAVMDAREVNPKTLFGAVQEARITYLFLPMPWVLDTLTALDKGELRKEDYDLGSLRLLLVGSQPVRVDTIRRWKAYFPNMPVLNHFGMTETTGGGVVTLTFDDENKMPSIGKAGFNWEARIVNDNGEDVAQGEVGELILKGNGVMKEYYKNPELTAKIIRDNWLFSGDLVRKDDDGYMYIVDRKKDVVISGGENIYPADIENVIITHPKVYDAAAIGIPDERLGEILAIVIEARPGERITEAEMREFFQPRLAKYRWPRRVIMIDKLPRGGTNKIDKPKLRRQYADKKDIQE